MVGRSYMIGQLLHNRVIIEISDPWELGEHRKWEHLTGIIIDVNENSDNLIIRIDQSFIFRNVECTYFIASPRHAGVDFKQFIHGESIVCGLTRITSEQANSRNPFDLSKWRGGIGIIGTIRHSDPITQ